MSKKTTSRRSSTSSTASWDLTPRADDAPGRVSHPVGEAPSKTRQESRDSTDINLILKRYAQRGMFDHVAPVAPRFGDFSEVVSIEEAFDLVRQEQETFAKLPGEVRAAADNNPVRFREMLTSEAGVEALRAAGLRISGDENLPPTRKLGDPPAPAPQSPGTEAPEERSESSEGAS